MLFLPEDVDTMPEQYCVPNVGDVTLGLGKTAYTIYFQRDSARLADRTNTGNPAGDIFEYTLVFSLKEIRLDVEWLRAKLRNRRVHAIVTYRTGLQRLLLNLRTASESDSGDRIGSPQRYNFSMTTALTAPAPTINSELSGGSGVVTPPEPPGLTIGETIIAPGGTVDIPEQRLVHAIVITPAASPNTIKIGVTLAGDEIMSSETIAAGENLVLNTAYYFSVAGTLYVTASENCSIIVYLR